MVVKILLGSNNLGTLFTGIHLNGNFSGICMTTTQQLCDLEGFQTLFYTKQEFYTTIINITPKDLDSLPDIALYYNLGRDGDLVRKYRIIKPHIVIYTKGDKIARLLDSDVKIELFITKKDKIPIQDNTIVEYTLYFNGEIKILPEMVEDDLAAKPSSIHKVNMKLIPFAPRKISKIPGNYNSLDYSSFLIDGKWIHPSPSGCGDFGNSDQIVDNFMDLVVRRINSNLLLDHILTIASNPTLEIKNSKNDKIWEAMNRINGIINELTDLKKLFIELS